jgi:hypothetical protein
MHVGLMMGYDYRAGKTQEELSRKPSPPQHTPRSGASTGSSWPNATSLPQKVGEPYLLLWRPS